MRCDECEFCTRRQAEIVTGRLRLFDKPHWYSRKLEWVDKGEAEYGGGPEYICHFHRMYGLDGDVHEAKTKADWWCDAFSPRGGTGGGDAH